MPPRDRHLEIRHRLKAAGVQDDQAEAVSRAYHDELAGGVATKDDLERAVTELKTEITKVDTKLETQGRYVFLVLALIAALGLYNAVAPHVRFSAAAAALIAAFRLRRCSCQRARSNTP